MEEQPVGKVYIGIDNGVTGAIGIIYKGIAHLHKTPVKLQQDYTKKKQNLNRVNVVEMNQILAPWIAFPSIAILERPFVNPRMWKATLSAVRCLEAQLCILESLSIPYMFTDSKAWQRQLLPQGCKKEELKKASLDIGLRLFPRLVQEITQQKDADAILIAEWARRAGL